MGEGIGSYTFVQCQGQTPISTDKDIVRGHIAWDEEAGGELPCLVIDGKELSWHEFGRMLMTYEGFHFKLEIFEGSEEK